MKMEMDIFLFMMLGSAIGYYFGYWCGKKNGFIDGKDEGYKEALGQNDNRLSKDEVDMIRQVLNVISWDGEDHENKDKSK
jgi:hypothetical protein